jgi:hypothetical protein
MSNFSFFRARHDGLLQNKKGKACTMATEMTKLTKDNGSKKTAKKN